MGAYRAITDWSRAGRAALVEAHRDELAALLANSLATVAAPYGEERLLAAFDFATLEEAVEWSLNRFATGDLDPARLSPGSRTFRLFTEARFWLCQRASRRGYQAIMKRLAAQRDECPGEPEAGAPEQASEELDVKQLRERLARTLRELGARTCADLVGWWLVATDELRAEWFEVEPMSPAHVPDAKKARSVIAHDAQFRFQCLHKELLAHDGELGLPFVAAREWLFQPCENAPPYRRSEEEIAAALPAGALRDRRAIQQLRRTGVEALLVALVRAAQHRPEEEDGVALMEWTLLMRALARTTLVAFKLDERGSPELKRWMSALPTSASGEDKR